MQQTPVPAGLLACLLLIPLRGQETRQKQAVAADRGRSTKNPMKHLCLTTIAIFGLIIGSAEADTVLIDNSSRNGGFESGTATPWGGVSVVLDSSFAHTGDYYGQASGTRGDVFQFLPVSNADGHDFSFSFWARIPAADGFTSLSVSLSDTGFSNNATVTPLMEPSLSSAEWRFFSYSLSTPSGWNDSGNSKISIAFPNSPGTRFAYLDDVTLTQVPEPSSVVLILSALAASMGLSRGRRR